MYKTNVQPVLRLFSAMTLAVLCTLFLSAGSAIAATPMEEWVARYNGPTNGDENLLAMVLDSAGNVYVTGVSGGNVAGSSQDYATVKYNSNGVQQWVATYDGPIHGTDCAWALAVDGTGNVYVTGESMGGITGFEPHYDYATVKYNSSGVQQWVVRYNSPGDGYDRANAIAVDNIGNVYVTGISAGFYTTIKYDSSGLQQWISKYKHASGGAAFPTALKVDSIGNVYVTGWDNSNGLSEDYATVKYNSSGVQQWVARYNGPGNGDDEATALAIDSVGNIYVTGWSLGSGTNRDYTTVKYNNSGIQQWVI